ncbi:MAG: tetratricopeptide repeat protein, partial [Planctomycetes bacterium]|nr:tetratricopeptide repeat protein [Planctomycetota bacterium]
MSKRIPSSEAFDTAVRHHQAGRLAEAEQIYRQILQAEPNNAQALHQLGRLAIAAGQQQAAVELIGKAIAADRRRALFHVSLGEAFHRWGKITEAVVSHRQALAIDPNLPLAHTHLGMVFQGQRDFSEAEVCFRRAAAVTPKEPQAHANLGRALYDQGRLAEAELSLREASRLAPDRARGHYNLATILHQQGKLDEAGRCYRRSLELNPNDVDVHNNLGMLLAALGAAGEAEAHYRRAAQIDPQVAAAHNNLAVILADQHRHVEAVAACRKAVEVAPDSAAGYCNMARSLQNLGQIDEAIQASRRAIELDPKMAGSYCNLGMCQQERGQLDEAIAAYRTGIGIDPADWQQHSNLIYALNYHPGFDPQTVFDEHREWGRRHADPLTAGFAPHQNDRSPGRRLRIGYVSGHFRSHAVAVFAEPMLAAHDHAQFEIFCYSNFVGSDETTRRFQTSADHWRDVFAHSDQAVCEAIRRDAIDVLVDLDGHINGNRLPVFARKPAPIQVTYIGYQNTTGMSAMDYRLTDGHADPPGTTEAYYTEKLVRLPRSFFCYLPDRAVPPVGRLPALDRGSVTFGSFNQFSKVTPEVLAAWADLLRAVPDARLVLVARVTPWLERYVAESFERQGIDARRVELTPRRPHHEYLELISRVDVALDAFPFNGHTTTCDCLWQGVPVVTMAGKTYASRFGSTALVNLE